MSNRPKILMLTTQLGYGGAETSFIRLANFLAQSMEVTVALFTGDYGKDGAYALGHEPLHATITLLDKADTVSSPRRWWRRIAALRQLKHGKHATISFLSGPNLANVLSGQRDRTIVSLRGSRLYDPVAPTLQRCIFQYVLDPIVFRLAAHIVPVSAGLMYEIQRAAGTGMLSKVRVIPPFVEAASLAGRLSEAVPEPYARLQGQPVIVAVGRVSVEKGFHHLIRIFHTVAQSHPGAKLLLVGDGPMMATLRAQCTGLGLTMDDVTPGTASVLFAGYQKNPLPLMQCGRVYALASATEGFPSVLLEAMAAGLPVVAADTPWGARAILADDAKPATQPYPTWQPTEAPYGTLMPPIDAPEYAAHWQRILGSYMERPGVPNPHCAERVRRYDLATVGAQWQQLIEGLTRR